MPRVTLDETYSLPDPMLNDNFDLVFSDIPGGGDGRQMRIQCLGAALPGATLGTVEVELFGHKLVYAGRKTFTNSMTVAFHEVYDGSTYQALRNWQAAARATATQTGGFSDAYMRTAILTIYDQTGAEAASWDVFRMFPTEVSEYQFEGAGGQAIRQDATFAFGHHTRR